MTQNKEICNATECPNACEQNDFVLSITTAVWPTNSYLENSFDSYVNRAPQSVLKDIKKAIRHEYDDADNETSFTVLQELDNPHFKLTRKWFEEKMSYDAQMGILDYFRENLAQIRVFFRELNYQSVVETPAMDVIDLLISLGKQSFLTPHKPGVRVSTTSSESATHAILHI